MVSAVSAGCTWILAPNSLLMLRAGKIIAVADQLQVAKTPQGRSHPERRQDGDQQNPSAGLSEVHLNSALRADRFSSARREDRSKNALGAVRSIAALRTADSCRRISGYCAATLLTKRAWARTGAASAGA